MEPRDPAVYGLDPKHDQSRTEKFNGYYLAFTWQKHPEDSRVYWVNWMMSVLYADETQLARHDARAFPPHGEHAIPSEQWRDAEFIANGFVKWDACSQWKADIHLDSNLERATWFLAIERVHAVCAEIMTALWLGDDSPTLTKLVEDSDKLVKESEKLATMVVDGTVLK